MAQSLSKMILHLVFSTKERQKFITRLIRPRLHGYLAQVAREMGCEVHVVGGVADHVHLAIDFPRTITVADLLKKLKGTSSVWMKEQDREFSDFAWQGGYGVFSVSASHKHQLIEYIAHQEERHRKLTFEQEYRQFLTRYDIQVDEKYLWD
jgi:REP element-mobilizing transposase RayT